MKELILKHSLINAVEHEGKARVEAVLKKVLAEDPKLKERIKEVVEETKRIVEEVNRLSLEEQKEKMEKLEIKVTKKEGAEVGLPPLPCAEVGKVVMRIAPFPSGPLHIGNARMVILNDEYVKRYKGKLILVFDDTIGSEEKVIVKEAYDLILDGLNWLGVKYDEIFYKSDRLEIFYDFARKLIERGLAYVCECDTETLRKNRREGKECIHRNQSIEENMRKFELMLSGEYKEGEATLRLKTDMKHKNPAFRDRVLLRVVEREHPRVGKKYRVWPMLEFSWAVDDQLLGITHILRGKDLVIEDMVEEFIWEKLGLRKPKFIHYGLFSLKDAKLSKTEARKAIERGEYRGWDDPRTWSLQSLRKRGIRPEAIRKFILGMGLSLADVSLPAEILYAENRKIIDPFAKRFFAILNPVRISIENAPKIEEVEARVHPDFPEMGYRTIPVNLDKIYIEKGDLEKFKGKEVRLIDLVNVKLGKKSYFTSKEMKIELQKIHWVSEPNVKIKLVMPNGEVKELISEPGIEHVREDEIVQFVRIGFARCDEEGIFYFSHK